VTVFRSSGGTAYRFHLHAPTETVTDVGNVFVAGPIGSGKAQPLDANVLTPMGWKKMGALAVGDLVTAPDGSFVPITGVFPQGDKPVFRVTFEDGRTVECCDEHLWKIWDCNKEAWTVRPLAEIRAILARGGHTAQRLAIPLIEPFAAELPSQDLPIPPYALGVLLGDGSFRTGHVRLTTADPEHILTRITADLPDYEAVHVSGTDFDYRFRMKHRQQMTLYGGKPSIMATVLTHEGVSFTAKQWAKDLRIDDEVISARLRREWPVPQVLGFERRAVSKGRASVARLINHDGETKTLREWAAVYGTYPQQLSQRLLWGWSMAQALGLAPRPQVSRNRSPLGEALSQLGLTAKASYEKSVPEAYKRSSVAQRLALLQGLLDTDGSVGNGTHASFTSTSERLARDVQEIAWSLGARAKLARRQTHFTGSLGEKKAGRPSWRVSIVHPDISRLFSLPRKVAQCKPKAMQHRLRIVRIEEAGVKPMRCISVGHPDQLYVTDGFVVTHNTTLVLFLLAMVERQKAQVVFFDRDRGGDILARAVGGTYLVLPSGEPSGLAPLKALTDKPADLEFLKALVKALVLEPGRDLLPEHERLLDLGVRSIMGLPPQARSFSELRAFLGQSDPEGPGAKLDKWCQGGALGWVLDNDADAVSLDAPFLGFDVTAVLNDPVTRGPILSYLFHRVESLLDGRRLVLAIDEFWKVLLDPGFRDLVNEKLKTIRKLNGLVILVTQSAADALRSPIAHSIIEQCPTQILLPNARADAADYRDGLKLTEPEYLAVREPGQEERK
jgi:type IV secretion system protein VirB4